MPYTTLISATELQSSVNQTNIVILDCRAELTDPRAGAIAYAAGHIPSALHADADLYASYKDILENLYHWVVPGGVIVLDEYMNTWENAKFPGARKAIDEFFQDRERVVRDEIYGKFYVVKSGS